MDLHLIRRREFLKRLNIGSTSFWKLQKAGVIPPPHHLPMSNGKPGKLCFWPNTVVNETVAKLTVPNVEENDRVNAVISRANDPFGRALLSPLTK